MEKTIENGNFTYELSIEKVPNGVSCVAFVKSFVQPESESRKNKNVIVLIEERVESFVKDYMNNTDVFSRNYIVDFDCTKNSLHKDKWSRMRVDLYLFAPSVEVDESVFVDKLYVLCEGISRNIEDVCETNRFSLAMTNL